MSNLNTFNLNNFNAFLEKAKQAVMCDSNCQKQKTAEELKQKYLASETNLASADNQVAVAQKNYLTFTQGELSYSNEKEDDLHKKAQLIIGTFNLNFQNDSKKINYLHWNPVVAGFVTEPWYWKYSSAIDYMTKEKGLLDVVFLE